MTTDRQPGQQTIAVLPLGRNTFDTDFAEQQLELMLQQLQLHADAHGNTLIGSQELLYDASAARDAIAGIDAADQILILQVTFTDAATTLDIATHCEKLRPRPIPLSIWAIPEPRLGERLRLNAFCGLNLASHALGRQAVEFSWLYRSPDVTAAQPATTSTLQEDLHGLFGGQRLAGRVHVEPPSSTGNNAADTPLPLAQKRVLRIGDRPDGFITCDYNATQLQQLTGLQVDSLELTSLFDEARAVDASAAAAVVDAVHAQLDDVDSVDAVELERSCRLKCALDNLHERQPVDAFALRCWPETFTEYGGAVCGPASMLGENRVPCAGEADVYGAATQLLLQDAANDVVFLVDIVDMDCSDDTAVVWHCGQAPASMCDADVSPRATLHTNRKMPLLYEFPLKPGRITLVRLSQGFNEPKLILAGGEVLKRDMAFTGTSGVVRFDNGTDNALQQLIDCGLEHHMALVYGDCRAVLRTAAARMQLPVVEW